MTVREQFLGFHFQTWHLWQSKKKKKLNILVQGGSRLKKGEVFRATRLLLWTYLGVSSSLLSGSYLISGHKDFDEAGSVQSISCGSVRNLLSHSQSSGDAESAAGLFSTRWWYRSSSGFPASTAAGSPPAGSHSHLWVVSWKFF